MTTFHNRAASFAQLQTLVETAPNIKDALTLPVLKLEDFTVDFTRHPVNQPLLTALLTLAKGCAVEQRRDAMLSGKTINETENRAVLHTALRAPKSAEIFVGDENVVPKVHAVLAQMDRFVSAVHSGKQRGASGKALTTIVNIGIGGSDLGPRMAVEALWPYHRAGLSAHFISNVDGAQIHRVLQQINIEETLFIVASKSFTTQETLMNAATARATVLAHYDGDESVIAKHFIALSTNEEGVAKFGIDPDNMFPFWDWVGGRYSLWSAIGLSLALMIGMENFQSLLGGAHEMDQYFAKAPMTENMPLFAALLGVLQRNGFGRAGKAVLPYAAALQHLPSYLQQLDMESNGKSVDHNGAFVDYATGPIVFGQPGTDGQHAFYQLLHQGTEVIPCDIIMAREPHHSYTQHHDALTANALAQADALAYGRDHKAHNLPAERHFPGNRPVTLISFDRLTPRTLGRLLAFYEHKVFVQGVIWNINSFDQFGVELGKVMARERMNR